ncbi:hypothetical protein E4U54_003158 [Claviceps lovelessii]|nr:hypothetical protein E4U54_003158 [Claviceps lovelessii]
MADLVQVITTPTQDLSVPWSRLTVGPLPNRLAIGRIIIRAIASYHAASLVVSDVGHGVDGE